MKNEILKAYSCYNTNDEIREISTSGGMFFLFSSYFIEHFHGKVCGAAFDENFQVIHKIVDNVEGLKGLLGSKYPQSKLGNTYKEVKESIDSGENILFCGTPCQVEGLISFLKKKPDNLWLIDFVCHGVASPRIWKDYLNIKTKGKGPTFIRFKDKKYGWKHWHVHIKTADSETYEDAEHNLFMKSYLARINVRPSCYECSFKGLDRFSDYTLADCWGIGEKDLEMNDNKGLSALMIHSERGMNLFDHLHFAIKSKEYDPSELMENNWAAVTSVKRNDNRKSFFACYHTHGLEIAFKRFFSESIMIKLKKIAKQLLNHIGDKLII